MIDFIIALLGSWSLYGTRYYQKHSIAAFHHNEQKLGWKYDFFSVALFVAAWFSILFLYWRAAS